MVNKRATVHGTVGMGDISLS